MLFHFDLYNFIDNIRKIQDAYVIGLNFRNKVHFLFIGRESSHLRNINYFDFKKIFLTHLTQGLALSIPFQIVF